MMSTGTMAGAWHPKTTTEIQLLRSQLDRIVRDSRFAASKRYPQLLRYVVEQTLSENDDNLKERTLGVEVFHRAPDYDTNLDPVVRLCAAEVRKRLAQYYQSPEHADELRIELNPGSYVPVFSQPPLDAPPPEIIPAEFPSKSEQVGIGEHFKSQLLHVGRVGKFVLAQRYLAYAFFPAEHTEQIE